MGKKRDVSLDGVRIFAVFSVISVHFFRNNGFYQNPITGARMFLMTMMRSFFVICVPLFLVLTGYLMLSKELNRQYYKGIVKTLGIYVIASVACIIFKNVFQGASYGITGSIAGIFNYTADDYAWYIEMYIGLFLLIPFLNLIYNGLKNKKQKLALIGTFLLLTSMPAIFNIFSFSGVDWWLHPASSDFYQKVLPESWTALYPVTLYYIGAYLREYDWKISKKRSLVLLGVLVIFAGVFNYYRSYGGPFVWGSWAGYSSPIVIAMTILVFVLIQRMKIWKKISTQGSKVLKILSDCALGAYLISYIFDTLVYPYFLNRVPDFSYKLGYYFICVPIVFVCSMVASGAMNLIYGGVKMCVHKIWKMMRNKFA